MSDRWIQLVFSSRVGGTERVAQLLDRELAAAGIDGFLALPTVDDEPRDALGVAWHSAAGARTVSAPELGAVRGWRRLPMLIRWHRAHPARVVHLHTPTLRGFGIADVLVPRLLRRRVVVTLQHPEPLDGLAPGERLRLGLQIAIAHRVVASTPFLARPIIDSIGRWTRRRLSVVPLAVEPPAHRHDKATARARLGLPPDALILISVTRLTEEKRTREVAEIVEELAPQLGCTLLVVGDGPEREALLAHGFEHSRILGHVDDLELFYAAADLHVLASDLEGFGLVFLEAAHHEVPSIGTCAGGSPWSIQDGVTGWLIPPRDWSSLRGVLVAALTDHDERRRRGVAARARALVEHSPTTMARRYAEVAGLHIAPR